MSKIEWVVEPVEYEKPASAFGEEVTVHPLKPAMIQMVDGHGGKQVSLHGITGSTSMGTPTLSYIPINNLATDPLLNHSSLDGSDPLTQFAREDTDPLSKIAADEWDYSANVSVGKKSRNILEENDESWAVKRAFILGKYTTSEKLSIITSFLPAGEKVIVKIQQTGALVDKVKTRLEQLDDFEESSVRQMLDLSQQEYTAQIEQLNNELVQAWQSDQRVKALKIAIQCAKLLVDTSVMPFYPSKFVLITDILDIFGKLVYDRLKMKSQNYCKPGSKVPNSLPDDFTADMVPESAKETCRNWFYKIASIRELVPRLYVEMAIIKSYSFLTTSPVSDSPHTSSIPNDGSAEYTSALLRITRMIRGIGNPLVAVFARCYLCRVGRALGRTSDQEIIKENLYDFLFTYRQLFSQSVKNEISKQDVSFHLYLSLYTPALDWIVEVMAATSTDDVLDEILSRCKQQTYIGLLLNTILNAFKPTYVAPRSMEFVKLVETCVNDGFPQYLLYRSLGECLLQESPPKDDCQLVLTTVWKYVVELHDPSQFMHCTEIWIEFVVTHFSTSELNGYLGEIISHLTPNRSFEHFYPQLQNIVKKIIVRTQDLESLLTMENFLPLIDLFHKDNIKVDVCKTIIEGLSVQTGSITDPVIINALMFIAKIMHDSVSALTVEDEKRQIGNLICGLVQRVDYGRDFEKQLNFYAEARAAFPNLDSVHIQLVQCVNRLSIDTRKIVRGHHTRRTSAFVRACAAFCFITIPSLTLVFTRLQLYLLSGQVALLNQCLGQADACFKAALNLVSEMPKTIDIDGRQKNSEPCLLSYLSNFLSTLLVVPDSPEHGVLYLMRGLLNAVQRCFDENSSTKAHLYLRVLDLLSTVTQENYPYHIDKVDSNDKLYGSDKKFVSEVNKICTTILEELLNHLKYLGSTEQYEKQSILALELFTRIIVRADLRQPALANVAVNLWNLSQRHSTVDQKLRMKTLEYMKRKSRRPRFQHFTDILMKISKRI